MKKVVDYGLFMRTVGMTPINGALNKEMFINALKEEYPPDKGWEIIGTHFVAQSPEGYTYGIFLQRVEYA